MDNFCRRPYFGALHCRGAGALAARGANFTDTAATECVGCLEAGGGDARLRGCVLLRSHARAHNGALCTRALDSLAVVACVFDNCSHTSDEADAAACLLAYENPADSGVADTDFVACAMDGARTIAVASGAEMIVVHCRFSGARQRELGQRVAAEDCEFGAAFAAPRPAQARQWVVVRKRRRNRDALYATAAGIAAVLALALTGAQALLHRAGQGTLKAPKAFQ
jgi:hypothetical protein